MHLIQSGRSAITMTSLELVDFINDHRKAQAEAAGAEFPSKGHSLLQHKHLLDKVPEVLGERCAEFLADLPDAYGRPRTGYSFPKREACLMAMSYSYELQAKVFDRMTELEAGSAPVFKVPTTLSGALRLAAEQAELIEQQQAQIEAAAPAVAFIDRYVQADGLRGFREVCKLLKANEARFRDFVLDRKIMYRLGGALTAHQQHIDAGRFEVRTGEANQHAYTTTKFTAKGVSWIAGEWAKHQLLGSPRQEGDPE